MIASLPSTDSSTTQRSTRTPCASTRLRVASGRVAFALLLMLSIWLPAPAMAQTCTVTMADVNFGNVDATQATPTDVTGTMKATCSGYATPYALVCVNLGAPAGNWDARAMKGPTATNLSFNIYSDPAFTMVWGSKYDPQKRQVGASVSLSSGAGSVDIPYYARVFGGQTTVPAGAYSSYYATGDTVVQATGYSGTAPACTDSIPELSRFSFTFRATVVANCTVTATNLDFGQIGFIAAAVDATGIVTATCTNGAAYSVALDAGIGSGATFASRRMTLTTGSSTLAYGLYTDAARTTIWGDGSGGSSKRSGTGNGSAQAQTVYGRIPSQGAVPIGQYSDTIVVTVTF